MTKTVYFCQLLKFLGYLGVKLNSCVLNKANNAEEFLIKKSHLQSKKTKLAHALT